MNLSHFSWCDKWRVSEEPYDPKEQDKQHCGCLADEVNRTGGLVFDKDSDDWLPKNLKVRKKFLGE